MSYIVDTLTRDPAGKADLRLDGVMRSFSSNGTVLSYYQLTPSEISGVISWLAIRKPDTQEQLLGSMQSVDGTLVTDDAQLYNAHKPLVSPLLEGDSSPVARAGGSIFSSDGTSGVCGGCNTSLMCDAFTSAQHIKKHTSLLFLLLFSRKTHPECLRKSSKTPLRSSYHWSGYANSSDLAQ